MDSIIFDLDGTLWDPIDTVLLAWNNRIKQLDQVKKEVTQEEFRNTMGLQIQDIGKILFPYLNQDVQTQVLKKCCELERVYLQKYGGNLYENVEHVLETLSEKYKLYIVSNCQDGYIETFYKYHKLERYFLDYENPGRTGLSKGKNINLIIERNKLTNPIYVGDTESDLTATKYAGIPFVYAKYGFGKVSEYDYVINQIDELLDIL